MPYASAGLLPPDCSWRFGYRIIRAPLPPVCSGHHLLPEMVSRIPSEVRTALSTVQSDLGSPPATLRQRVHEWLMIVYRFPTLLFGCRTEQYSKTQTLCFRDHQKGVSREVFTCNMPRSHKVAHGPMYHNQSWRNFKKFPINGQLKVVSPWRRKSVTIRWPAEARCSTSPKFKN